MIDLEHSWLLAYQTLARDLARRVTASESEASSLAATVLERSGWPQTQSRPFADSPLTWALTEDIARIWQHMPEFSELDNVVPWMVNGAADATRFPPVAVTPLKPLFERLAPLNLHYGVATMDSEAKAHAVLKRFEITDVFAFVAGCDSGYGVKPGPGMLHGFCNSLNIPPSDVMVIGDTHADMGMARSAGAGHAVGVLSGGGDVAALRPIADTILQSIGDLPEFLGLGRSAPHDGLAV